jgi:hypothetical protein
MSAPRFDAVAPTSSTGNYTLQWSAVTTSAPNLTYELEEQALPTVPESPQGTPVSNAADYEFLGYQKLVYTGPERSFGATGKTDAQYLYRVRARTDQAVSPWSPTTNITVAIDTSGVGESDAYREACGAIMRFPNSTCEDFDADRCPAPLGIKNPTWDAKPGVAENTWDQFPRDPSECKDSDGDGTGDGKDTFPHDPTDWRDLDSDRWGDNAERRLGSDTSKATSTPETDDDSDGCLNKDEASARKDPRNASSHPDFCFTGQGTTGPIGGKGLPGFEAPMALVAPAAALVALRRRRE